MDSVRRLHGEFQAACQALREQDEPSLELAMRAQWSKAIVLAAASHFEREVCSSIVDLVPRGNSVLGEFVQRQGLERRYHSMFSWKAKNANSFYALFGPEFSIAAKEAVSEDDGLGSAVREFLALGQLRNEMVHGDFASFSHPATAEEVFLQFETAERFVTWVKTMLQGFQFPVDGTRVGD